MDASLAVGAVVSGAFNVLFERLTPGVMDAINTIVGKPLDAKLLRRLKPSLTAAKVVLFDAELKQFNYPVVKDWLDELVAAVYELEDLLDEIVTIAAAKEKVRDSSSDSGRSRDTNMADRLEEITATIEYIVGKKDVLNLEKISGRETLSWRPPVTSRVGASKVYGREKEKKEIIQYLLNRKGGKLSVIPIVGMGGVGKTTLVNLVYNDKDLKPEFDFKAWVCVSETFDLLKIAQTIIKSVNPDFLCDNMDLNLLQLHLAKKLAGQRLLAVLDDVWSDKFTDWDALKNFLPNEMKKCKILVTTRLERVGLMVKTIPSFYPLKVLSDEDCLSIFAEHAFHLKDSSIRRDVANKCKGLPLAAKVLGGLFGSNPDLEDWNSILKDAMWDSLDNEIFPALRVSYYHLPPHLKQCFAYCSLFPENYPFDKTELVLMWMAEGFLQPSKGNSTLEEVGFKYINDLTSRSFFQPLPGKAPFDSVKNKTKLDECFVMHDLIHELATHVAGDFYFRLGESGDKISNKTHHLSCNFKNYPCLDHGVFQKLKGLRTFIGLNFSHIPKSIESAYSQNISSNLKYLQYLRTLSLLNLSALKKVPESIWEFIHLRYLNLSGTSIECLPDSICKLYNLQTLELCDCILESLPSEMQDLVNLRYLDLSSSKIASLPDSLCKLYNLQTLKLRYCHYLEMLPSDMRDLVNLRHLDISNTCLKEMPRGLGNLKDLQLLSDFIVGKEQETGIGELGGISNLKGWIRIRELENVKSGNEACDMRMREKKHIKDLTLSWSEHGAVRDSTIETDTLLNLEPHWSLEELRIQCYTGTRFPDWLGSPSYRNITFLQLFYCVNCRMLPPLWQLPALKELHICGLESVVSIGDALLKGNSCTSKSPFPSLEVLEFSKMTSWERWHPPTSTKAFPKLRELRILNCEKLTKDLPGQLLSLVTLKIGDCPLLFSYIPSCDKLQKLETCRSENVLLKGHELPPLLCELEITGCRMLESMLKALSKHSHLHQLTIRSCSNVSTRMIHLPLSLQSLNINNCEIDFVMSSTNPLQDLQSISINECNSVKFRPNGEEGLLPNLKKLSISSYSHEIKAFPEGLLVPSLEELCLRSCNKLLCHQAEWDHLSNTTYLYIRFHHNSSHQNGSYLKRFPNGSFLPTTLTTLELVNCEYMETLDCTELQKLTSLKCLLIKYCKKLENMSGKSLPITLKELYICGCPLLEEKYHNKDEQLLCKISHINLSWM